MRNVLPVADLHARDGGRSVVCVNRASPIPDEFALPGSVQWCDVGDVDLPQRFHDDPPAGLVVGTTGGMSLERTLTRMAREVGVPSVAVLDEWYNYAVRFRSPDGSWNLPTRIAAMNAMAVDEAVLEGLPRNRLFCSGSVWLSELARQTSAFRPELEAAIGTAALSESMPGAGAESPASLQVTFISENFTSETEEIPGMPYDEHGVLRDVIAALDALDSPVRLINKVHPSRHDDPDTASGSDTVHVETHARGSLLDFMAASDLCIGMKSMGLLEASMMGKPVLSYQPGMTPEANIGTAVRLGVCPLVTNRKSLHEWLSGPWDRKPESTREYDFISSSAPRSILNELTAST